MYINYLTRTHFPEQLPLIHKLDTITLTLCNSRKPSIYPGDKLEIPKIVNKYMMYNEIALHRICDLTVNTVNSWNNGVPGICYILVRSILENFLYVYDIKLRIRTCLQNKQYNELDNIIMKNLFGAKKEQNILPKITNILTILERVEKYIRGISDVYVELSECCHPNYMAMYELYCRYHKESHESEISTTVGINEGHLITILAPLVTILEHFQNTMKEYDEIYAELTEVCNEHFEKRKEPNSEGTE